MFAKKPGLSCKTDRALDKRRSLREKQAQKLKAVRRDAARELPAPQRPCAVDDTVYLEDGKAFRIVEISGDGENDRMILSCQVSYTVTSSSGDYVPRVSLTRTAYT